MKSRSPGARIIPIGRCAIPLGSSILWRWVHETGASMEGNDLDVLGPVDYVVVEFPAD